MTPDEPKVRRYFVGSVSPIGLAELDYDWGPEDTLQYWPKADEEFVSASDYDALRSRLDAVQSAALAKDPMSGQYREYDELVAERDALRSRLEAVLRAADAMATDLEWYASEGKQMFYLVNGTKLRADFTSRAREALAAYRDATSAEKEGT